MLSGSRVRPAVAVALWSVQALSAAYWVRSFQYADDDSGYALHLARECLERAACATGGNPTSAFGLVHGAAWIRLIRYCLAIGGGLATVQLVVIVLLVAATIVSSIVVWRTVSWRAGMMASLVVLPATLAIFHFDSLANGTLLPLPLALYYASTVWFLTSRRTRAALVASVCLAASMSPDLECIVLVPFHIALVASVATKPLATAAAAALTVGAAFAIESPAAAVQLWRGLVSPSIFILGLLLVIGAAAAIPTSGRRLLARIPASATSWRQRFVDFAPPVRLRVAMKLAAMYVITAVSIAPTLAMGFRIPDPHYFAPALFPLVFLVADATHSMPDRAATCLIAIVALTPLSLLFAPLAVGLGGIPITMTAVVSVVLLLANALRSPRRFVSDLEARPSSRVAIAGAMLVCVMCIPDALIYPRIRQLWPVAAAEDTVRDLYASGFTFAELMAGLQGPAAHTVQTMIVNWDPHLFADPPRAADATSSLLAIIVDRGIAARTHDVLMRRDTPSGDGAVLIRSLSVMDRARIRACSARSCGDPVDPERCTTRDPDGLMRHSAPFFPIEGADAARAGEPASDPERAATYCVRVFIPLRMSGTGEAHWLRVENNWPLDIRIQRIDGVPFDGTVPGAEVRLSNDHRATGTVELEIEAHAIGPNPFIEQPPVIEVTAENEHLLDGFRQGRVTVF